MAYRPTLKFKNAREVQRNLARISDDLQEQAQEAALLAGALIISNDAKRRAPIRTGTLRRSIHVGGHTNQTPEYQPAPDTAALPKPKQEGRLLIMYIGTNVEYAPYVEYGLSNRQAKPYLRPAFDTNKEKVLAEMGAVIEDFVKDRRP